MAASEFGNSCHEVPFLITFDKYGERWVLGSHDAILAIGPKTYRVSPKAEVF